MSKRYEDDSLALHTDLYEINMAKTYLQDQVHNRRSVFEAYFRNMPFGGGYAIFAGLERVIDFIANFRFTESDLDYLHRELQVEEEFIDYLRTVRFTGDVRSVVEGEIIFANEPIVQVDAPLAQAQLIETPLLNMLNFHPLIATKASRIRLAVGADELVESSMSKRLMEFGARRAHELDAALYGARAAYIGGFDATSNVRAGKLFGIPVAGTHAHALVQVYRDEYTAFKKYAESHKNCIFLVDTYNTLKSGVPNAIKVAKEMGDSINFVGIRLDSGKLPYLSQEARKMLDEAGFTDAKIFASNDLDEYTIMDLKSQGAKIDGWGVGTKLMTSYEQPALGAVYKLVSIEDQDGQMVDTIKLSENPEKISTPGLKDVYRIVNQLNNKWEGDYITLEDERPNEQEHLKMFHPVHTHVSKFVTNFQARNIHQDIFKKGELVYKQPNIEEMRAYCLHNLKHLWDDYKIITKSEKDVSGPTEYPVDLSTECWNNKMENIEETRLKVAKKIKEISK
ncbi:nicotinate phosphoribosyltransferase [Metabacillus iocasae]|uniref:Nicotinate phosphoribosyltransferase n=1 Tax=Priestia iocasae TaxID=2291674 RepID=A0ABS2R0J1_9BACI|nr:nicotinate phosphoribosyltransferase [Metabacillus iocasae]MBM7704782.1 nicotinate phosphoribosyltransferase [Metabacillus iocasae]